MGSNEGRRCAQCGVPLSRSNAGTRCAPCQREPVRRLDPSFWTTSAVREAAASWDIGVVVRLFRQHTGLSQAAVARLVNIDQAEVSRLERGRKKIRDRRQLAQWCEALGMPDDLMGPLPRTEGIPVDSAEPTGSPFTLPEGSGQLLLPAGRNLPPTALPTLVGPAASFRGNSLWISPSPDIETWTRMPLRALLVASRTVDGAQRHFVMDAREAAARAKGTKTIAIPAAYELDDLTYGILWAVAGFDSAFLGDDAALTDLLSASPPPLSQDERRSAIEGLADGAQMLLSSQACAQFILGHRGALADTPLFWTREQRGEEAANWLLFKHKHRYLRDTASKQPHSGVGRAFCIPQHKVAGSPAYERVLLFLAIALMESYGVTTWIADEPELQQTDGFVLVPGQRAVIATWVRAEAAPHTAVTARPHTLRTFADLTGHVQAHTVTSGARPSDRLTATADYLGLDRTWLARRCRQLAAEGAAALARPRSRHLSLDAIDAACAYVAAALQPVAGARSAPNR